jgi:hypothetical protein
MQTVTRIVPLILTKGRDRMAKNKYEKHITREPLMRGRNPEVIEPIIHLEGKDAGGANLTLSQSWITQPFLMIKEAHKHDYDQFVFFIGSNPLNAKEFDAEIEMWLGEEKEKYVITTPAVVHIPPGLMHGPLNFKRVGKPVVFLDVFLAPTYIRIGK